MYMYLAKHEVCNGVLYAPWFVKVENRKSWACRAGASINLGSKFALPSDVTRMHARRSETILTSICKPGKESVSIIRWKERERVNFRRFMLWNSILFFIFCRRWQLFIGISRWGKTGDWEKKLPFSLRPFLRLIYGEKWRKGKRAKISKTKILAPFTSGQRNSSFSRLDFFPRENIGQWGSVFKIRNAPAFLIGQRFS